MKKVFTLLAMFLIIFGLTVSGETTTIGTTGTGGTICCMGEPNVATMGQTFQLNAGDDTFLESMTLSVKEYTPTYFPSDGDYTDNADFGFYLYQWDGSKITGDSLFESSMISTTDKDNFEDITVNPNVTLATNLEYVFFLSASNYFDGEKGMAYMQLGDTYADGYGVWIGNGSNFSQLSSSSWSTSSDLAFTLVLSGGAAPVPEPSTMLLLGSGLLGMVFWRRKQRSKQG